jgi:hypothetical protein
MYWFRGVLEKSKWKMYDFGLMNHPVESSEVMTTLVTNVEELGGICETVFGCFLVYLPSECDFNPRKEAGRIAEKLNLPHHG